MSSFYQALAAARISDSTWQPSIFVDIAPPQCVSDNIPSCIDINKKGKTNLVPLTVPPSLILQTALYALKYPKKTSFCFEGFHGIGDQERLTSHIVDSALKSDGTELFTGINNHLPHIKK